MEGRTATADRYAAFKFYGRGTLLASHEGGRGRGRRGADDGRATTRRGLFKMLLLHRVIANKREIALQKTGYELSYMHKRDIDFNKPPQAKVCRQMCPV